MESMNVVNGVNFNEIGMEEKAMGTQNVMAQNVEETAMVNEEVQVQEEEMVKRFCVECGSIMFVKKGSRITVCDSCREAKKKATAERAHMLAKKRKEELGVVNFNVQVYEETRTAIKDLAKQNGMAIADLLKMMVDKMKDEKAEEAKQEVVA